MLLKDCQVGDRVRVWYDGKTIVRDNKGVSPRLTLEATIGAKYPLDMVLVWKPGELMAVGAWSLVAYGSNWTSALAAQGYDKGYWVDDNYECELVSSAAQTSNTVYSREDLFGYPDVSVATSKTETSAHSIPTLVPQEEPFDFDSYNGLKR